MAFVRYIRRVLRSIRIVGMNATAGGVAFTARPVLTMGLGASRWIDPQEDTGTTNLVFPDSSSKERYRVN